MTIVALLVGLCIVAFIVLLEVVFMPRIVRFITRPLPKITKAQRIDQIFREQDEEGGDGREPDYNAETQQERLDRYRDLKEGR